MRDILRICRYCLQQPHIRPVILFCGLLMASNLTALWAYFLLYQGLGIGVGWFGVLFAIFQLAGALGGALSHAFCGRFGARTPLFLALLIPLFFVSLGLFPSVWLLPLVPANALLWNLAYPVLLERLNLAVGSDVQGHRPLAGRHGRQRDLHRRLAALRPPGRCRFPFGRLCRPGIILSFGRRAAAGGHAAPLAGGVGSDEYNKRV